jgi:ADP-heptose:LPS heptosyltransferase
VLADPARVRTVLVLKAHDQLGDFLVATPAIAALRARYDAARVLLVTRDFLAPLAQRNPDVDEVLVLPRVSGPGELGEFVDVVRRVGALRPQLAFVLNSVSRSKTVDALAALSQASYVAGRSCVGHGAMPADAPADPVASAASGARDSVYDLDLEVAAGSRHQTDRLLDLVRWTGASADPTRLRLVASERDKMEGRARLDAAWRAAQPGGGPSPEAGARVRWIGIHPGAANALKCWPLERFVALGTALARDAALASDGAPREERRLVVFDAPRERGRAAAVHAGLLAHGVAAGFVPAGPLDHFIGAATALDLLVCNDSGVMHIAAALSVPTVSFHALGRPEEWAPRGRAVSFYAPQIGELEVEPARAAAEQLLAG